MTPAININELPFAYIDNSELINLLTCDNLSQIDKSFDPFVVLDDKYNSDVDITQSCLRSTYQNVPKSEYIFLESLSSINTNNAITTLLSMNIRSVPTNIQSFIDLILANTSVNLNIIGFTETRLHNDITQLYQLPGYNMFTKCRNRNGGGVAMYISSDYTSIMNNDLSFIESFMECISVTCTFDSKEYL